MSKKLTLFDEHQIIRHTFDEQNNANRVILVGGDAKSITDAVRDGLKDLKVEVKSETPRMSDTQFIKIPFQTIVKEPEFITLEKPIIVPEVQIVEIEKPVYIPEVIEVEKQVIVKQSEPLSTFIKTVLVIQTLAAVARVFFEIIHR